MKSQPFMRNHFALLLTLGLLLATGCGISKLNRLQTCEFRTVSVEKTTLAGVSVQGFKSILDFRLSDAGKITDAFRSGKMPLAFTLNVEARNPNQKPALMTKVDWIALIDDDQVATGAVERKMEIPGMGTAIIPFQVQTDLMELMKGKSKDALIGYVMGLAGAEGKPLRVTIRIKPYISIGKKGIAYPGYFKVEEEYSAD